VLTGPSPTVGEQIGVMRPAGAELAHDARQRSFGARTHVQHQGAAHPTRTAPVDADGRPLRKSEVRCGRSSASISACGGSAERMKMRMERAVPL